MKGGTVDSNDLKHWGVKGMRWGVRRSSTLSGVSHKTYKEAKRDAKEFTRAKMFYGEGAGNRRKLIKATVESKSKKDPAYKKAFDHHVENTDLGKRASQARGERARKDTTKTVGKTARGVKNLVLQTGAPVTIGAATIYFASKNPKVRAVAKRAGSKVMSAVKGGVNSYKARRLLNRLNIKW